LGLEIGALRMRARLIFLLSLYIDFIFVAAVVGFASFLMGRAFGYVGGAGTPYIAELALSVTMVGLGRALGLSAGKPLLSYAANEATSGSGRRLWANLLLGTLLTLDGLKQMVRWTSSMRCCPRSDSWRRLRSRSPCSLQWAS